MMVKSDNLFEKMGYKVPNFECVKPLGEGAFGQVFLMHETSQIAFPRAVKILYPLPFGEDKVVAEKRFKQEADCLIRLHHPSIVSYILSGFTADEGMHPYLVMEYIEGVDLLKFAESATPIQKATVVLEILKALSYAHSQGVIHRDIKPSNVIVRNSSGLPVIVDFGFSYIFEKLTSETLTTATIGSPGYIPPEIIATPKLRSLQHDVFSCGALLYRLFALTTPNVQQYEPLSSTDQNLAGLDLIIQQATASVEKRFATPNEFAEKLSHWIQGCRDPEKHDL